MPGKKQPGEQEATRSCSAVTLQLTVLNFDFIAEALVSTLRDAGITRQYRNIPELLLHPP